MHQVQKQYRTGEQEKNLSSRCTALRKTLEKKYPMDRI